MIALDVLDHLHGGVRDCLHLGALGMFAQLEGFAIAAACDLKVFQIEFGYFQFLAHQKRFAGE